MKKIKTNKLTILPSQLVEDIKKLKLTKIQENKCIHLVSLIRNKSKKDNDNYYSYVEIPSNYLKKVIHSNYKPFMNILINNKIIICDYKRIWNTTNNKSYYYCINNKYNILNNNYSYISFNSLYYIKQTEYQRNKEWFIDDIEQLNIDTDKLKSILYKTIDNLDITNFRINEQIQDDGINVTLKIGNYEKKYYTSLEKALITAKKHNLTVIQNKRKFYIMDVNEFIRMKKDFITVSYLDSIDKIKKGYWFANRNVTNNRLDSNITNMCSELIDEIKESNNLVELDLNNSQFSILSYILPKDVIGDDVSLFKELSYSGKLYEYLMEIMSLESRKEAKQLTFELLFSSHKNHCKKIKLLKEIFPNVINWINNYKETYGSNEFAVMLQTKESEMFISDIWVHLKKKKYFALTKHDCFLVKKEDEDEIREYIQMYFDSIGFEGKLKTINNKVDNMEKKLINTKLRTKLRSIKHNIQNRTKVPCEWSIEELYKKFNDWENHGKLWEIDHIHPVKDKLNYKGNINSFSNLQKLTIEEHRNKSHIENKEVRLQTISLIAERKVKNSKERIYEILECWDFEKYGKISVRNISNNFKINKKTITKYYSEFKNYIKELNNQYKIQH